MEVSFDLARRTVIFWRKPTTWRNSSRAIRHYRKLSNLSMPSRLRRDFNRSDFRISCEKPKRSRHLPAKNYNSSFLNSLFSTIEGNFQSKSYPNLSREIRYDIWLLPISSPRDEFTERRFICLATLRRKANITFVVRQIFHACRLAAE